MQTKVQVKWKTKCNLLQLQGCIIIYETTVQFLRVILHLLSLKSSTAESLVVVQPNKAWRFCSLLNTCCTATTQNATMGPNHKRFVDLAITCGKECGNLAKLQTLTNHKSTTIQNKQQLPNQPINLSPINTDLLTNYLINYLITYHANRFPHES